MKKQRIRLVSILIVAFLMVPISCSTVSGSGTLSPASTSTPDATSTNIATATNTSTPSPSPTATASPTPTAPPIPHLAAVSIAAGGASTCAITPVGGVKCWGDNTHGQLGNGSQGYPIAHPVDVFGLTSGVKAIEAGSGYFCAITTAGGLKCWGLGEDGQLGNGKNENSNVPVDVVGMYIGIKEVAAGLYNTCAVTEKGALKCWGFGGGLCWDNPYSSSIPVDVPSLSSGVKDFENGLVLMENGSLQECNRAPTPLPFLPTNVQAISAYEASCALLKDGGVQCWGGNSSGALGIGETNMEDYHATPSYVSGLTSGVVSLFSNYRSCVILINGSVKCWGDNYFGELGDGTNQDRYAPVDLTIVSEKITSIALGGAHTCVLLQDSSVKCWGDNSDGQYGNLRRETRRTVPLEDRIKPVYVLCPDCHPEETVQ